MKENPMSRQSFSVSRQRAEVARSFMSQQDFFVLRQRDVYAMETRSRHEKFRSRQSLVTVRRSHVVTEFICVETGNGHYASGKLVTIRHNTRNRGSLSCMTKTLCRPQQSWAHTTGTRTRLGCAYDIDANTTEVFCRDRLGQ